ncbi:proteasome subunit alpha type-1 [Sphaeroforma arctica JP610]|uniref:Proteasome subunit alpha type-1 n=1 Tax=Sphaeroforma arctica JP610 TaxID=667725 RepID=A0A0L0FW86_9EUKA|nr:proteasome subunit alpha type-1 [Sphaeroforma arctica JP610]KNC80919.1 proteasome subunit alpha type-1 [Sphaeroforma arctica JP610]|eukprot:XP_014154821.1 proteasome subunit alpha type-1 [Sphaeroforma arctica JP610]
MEAVNQGSCAVGIKSKTHAALFGLKRPASELSAHQKKLLKIDDHIGTAIAGLTSDARVLTKFMRSECLNNKYVFDCPLPTIRLVTTLGDKAQITTQRYGRRPYGVGQLIVGYDDNGPHLYHLCPSANFFDCKAMAIGARSQSARTYLERQLEDFPDAERTALIRHGLRALRDSLPNGTELTTANASVGIVGKDESFTILEGEELTSYLDNLDEGGPPRRSGRPKKDATTKAATETATADSAVPETTTTDTTATETPAADGDAMTDE